MCKGDLADLCGENFQTHEDGGQKHKQKGSEDPHLREPKFICMQLMAIYCKISAGADGGPRSPSTPVEIFHHT